MRASIYIEEGDARVLVDCGPDFRTQALLRGISDVTDLLLTHTHADHLNGLDDLRSYNMINSHAIIVHATAPSLADVRQRFAYCFQPPPPGGGIPQLELQEFEPGKAVNVRGIEVLPLLAYHGQLPIVGFRIGRFAYFTDVSEVPDESVEALRGVEVLITSALRHKPHPSHMSLSQAVELVNRVAPRQAWFTHMCHDLEHEATNRELPPGMALLYDGLSFEV